MLVINYIKNEVNMIICKLFFINLVIIALADKQDYGKYSIYNRIYTRCHTKITRLSQ